MPGSCAGQQPPGLCPGKAWKLGPEHALHCVGFQGWVRSRDGPHWEDVACPSSQPRPASEGWNLWAGTLVRACSWNVRAPSGVMIALACWDVGLLVLKLTVLGKLGWLVFLGPVLSGHCFPGEGARAGLGSWRVWKGNVLPQPAPSGPGLQPSLLQGGACDLILNVLELSLQGAQGLKFCRGSFRRNY